MPIFHNIVETDATVHDTLALLVNTVNKYSKAAHVKQVAKLLGAGTATRAQYIKNVFNYVCRNIEYKLDAGKAADGEHIEEIWTPAKIIDEGRGDCKKMSILIAALLKAGGYEPILKHVYYGAGALWTHIYVIVPAVEGGDPAEYITLDATNDCKYDSEVQYKQATLYFLNGKHTKVGMELHMLGYSKGGVEFKESIDRGAADFLGNCNDIADDVSKKHIGFSFGHRFHLPNLGNVFKQVEHKLETAVKDAIKNVPDLLRKVEHSLATVSAVYMRGIFLGAVKINTAGLAGNLLKMYSQDPNKVDKFWYGFGGHPNILKAAVIEGAKKHPLLGIGNPAVILAAAAPILAGAAMLIHQLKPGSPADKDMGALAAGTMTAAAGGGFNAIVDSAKAGYAAGDTSGTHTLPADGMWTPPGHTPNQYSGTTGGSFGILGNAASALKGTCLFSLIAHVNNYPNIITGFVTCGLAVGALYFALTPKTNG